MLGSANLGPSVYLVFTVILLKVVRLLQNLVHMVRLVPQTCTNSPLTTFNHFHIHNKNKHGTRICAQLTHEVLCDRVRRRTLSVRQA